MARQVRNRVTAIVLGGFLLGTAVVTAGTANAGPAATGSRQVVFAGGGLLGRTCRSAPTIESMALPAESTIRVVNLVDGSSRGTVAHDAATELVFRRAAMAGSLDPDCAITDQAMPVLVTVTPTTTPSPGETATPPKTPDGETTVEPSDTAEPTPDENPVTPTSPAATEPPATSAGPGPHVPRPPTYRPATTAPGGGTESPAPFLPLGRTPKIKDKDPVGTAGAGGQVLVGIPPGDEPVALEGVPELALPAATTATAPSPESASVSPPAEAGAVVAMRPAAASRPIGLLALVAMVCALGVGTGAIRAFVSQRASRASLA